MFLPHQPLIPSLLNRWISCSFGCSILHIIEPSHDTAPPVYRMRGPSPSPPHPQFKFPTIPNTFLRAKLHAMLNQRKTSIGIQHRKLVSAMLLVPSVWMLYLKNQISSAFRKFSSFYDLPNIVCKSCSQWMCRCIFTLIVPAVYTLLTLGMLPEKHVFVFHHKLVCHQQIWHLNI